MSETFYYSVIKLVPHPIREETFNLGVVLISGSGTYADFRFTGAYRSKLRALAADVHASTVRRFLEDFQSRFPKVGRMESLSGEDRVSASIETLTEFANYHSTQIKFTAPRPVLAEDPNEILKKLFEEFVAPIRLSRERIIDRPAIRSWLFGALRAFHVPKASIIDSPKIPVRHGFNTLDLGIRKKAVQDGTVTIALEPISFELPSKGEIVRLRDHVAWVAHDSQPASMGITIGTVVTQPTEANRALYRDSLEIFQDEHVEVIRFQAVDQLRQLLLQADIGGPGVSDGAGQH